MRLAAGGAPVAVEPGNKVKIFYVPSYTCNAFLHRILKCGDRGRIEENKT
jgi:hypothetical protein